MSPSTSKTERVHLGGIQAWVVVLVSALFFFYEFIQLNMFSTINTNLMQAFNVDATRLSNLSAGYFYADILLLFPAGIILDKFSTRKLLSAAMAISVIATFLLSFTHNYWFAFAMRLLSGFGAAFNLLSSLRLASRWFPAEKLALVTGAVVTMAMLGGVVAQTPMTLLVEHLGWRNAIRIDAALGGLFLLMIFFLVQDYPKGYVQAHIEKPNKRSLWQTIVYLISNPQNWLGGLYTSFLNLPILVLGALWGTEYLINTGGFSKTQASFINSMLFIGTIIGSPIYGWLSDKLRQRKLPMIMGAILSIVTVFVIYHDSSIGFVGMVILFLLLGIFTSAQVISYPLITESNPLSLTGSALGMASVLIMSGGAIFQPVMGLLLDWHWNGIIVRDVPVYNAGDYHFAFMIFPIMFVLSLLFAFFIRETHAVEEAE